MRIYLVPFLFGRMRLPMQEAVVADSEDEAQRLVVEWGPGAGEVEFKEPPKAVGEAYMSKARVLR